MLFQLCVVVGILVAQAVNVGMSHVKTEGWRISLGIAAIPGLVLLVGGLLLPESPNSLIERGFLAQVRARSLYVFGCDIVLCFFLTAVSCNHMLYSKSRNLGTNRSTKHI